MAAGTLVSVATPALAAPGDPSITINSLSNGNMQAGSQSTLSFTVKAGFNPGAITITVASSLNPDVTLVKDGGNCGGSCNFVDSFNADQAKQYTITLVAAQNPNVPAGQQKSGNITISANPDGGGATATKNQGITLQGAAQQQNTVVEVSGTVKEAGTNQPIPGASVEVQDGAGHNYGKKTDNFGKFSFKSTAQSPIIAGDIAIVVAKDGYGSVSRRATVQAGASYSFQSLTLTGSAAPSTSTNPAPSDTGTPAAVDSGGAAAPPANNAAKNSGGGSFSMILIGLGVLLVLLGIGAIAFILIKRRRDDTDEGDEYDDNAPQRGPTPVPASRGAYRSAQDPTAVVRSGGYADPTVVGGRSPLADAPTMMHSRPPVDEYPDPYGAPPPANHGGYEGGGQYGGGAGNTYGGQTYGGGQYGAGAGGGYDERGGYDDRAGHDSRSGGYDERGGYDDRGGYDPPGYDDRGGRGGYRGSTYGHPEPPAPPARERYDEPTTYEPRGYDQRGGYEPRGDGGGAGYDPYAEEQRGGYDQRGGYEEQPRGRHGGGGNPPDSRRQLDWLDD